MNTPLLLLHGWGFSSAVWRPLITALQVHGVDAIHAVDLPGFGTAFHEPCPALEPLLDSIAAQLPARAVVCGWSLGGMLALQLAARYPDRIDGIITLGSNLHFTQDGDWPGMPRADYAQFCQRFVAQPEKTWRRFLQLQLKGDGAAAECQPALDSLVDYSALQPVAAEKMLGLLGEIDNRALFPGLAVRGLHLFGEEDAITPVAVAGCMPSLNTAQTVRVLPGAGHALPVSRPVEVADAIATFLGQPAAPVPKSRVAASFSRAAATYDAAAHLQRTVGAGLLATLPSTVQGTVVDIGCGTGFISAALLEKQATVVSLDLAAGMLQQARARLPAACYVQADMEQLPLAGSCAAWLLSSLALQWANDLPACFREWRRVLQPGGHLLCSTFLPGTLRELAQCWAEVDDAVHVNRFVAEAALVAALRAAGFASVETVHASHTLYYAQLRDLARELKAIGAQNMNNGQPVGLTGRQRWASLQAAYECLREPRGLPATYEVLYVSAA